MQTAKANNVNIQVIRADLVQGLQQFFGKIDVLLFNPPYVPTDEDELSKVSRNKQNVGVEAAWAGGKDGIEPLLKLLPSLKVFQRNLI